MHQKTYWMSGKWPCSWERCSDLDSWELDDDDDDESGKKYWEIDDDTNETDFI